MDYCHSHLLQVDVEEVYTITTLKTGAKGVASKPVPPSTPFPLPFTQSFDAESVSAPPAYWYDQMGAWEVQAGGEKGGKVMRQVSPVWPNCWGYSCTGPTFPAGLFSFLSFGWMETYLQNLFVCVYVCAFVCFSVGLGLWGSTSVDLCMRCICRQRTSPCVLECR